jgi:hypothetical protein
MILKLNGRIPGFALKSHPERVQDGLSAKFGEDN